MYKIFVNPRWVVAISVRKTNRFTKHHSEIATPLLLRRWRVLCRPVELGQAHSPYANLPDSAESSFDRVRGCSHHQHRAETATGPLLRKKSPGVASLRR